MWTMALDFAPMMHIVIVVPRAFAARVEACVPNHRGRLYSSDRRDEVQTIHARVPKANVAAFVSALMIAADGTAQTSMLLYQYFPNAQPPPADPTAGVREPWPRSPSPRRGAIAVAEPAT